MVGYGRDPTVAVRILLARLLLARFVQQQVPMVDDSLQIIDSCERPCDHAGQWKCLRFRSSRIFGGISSSQQRQVLDLQWQR